MSARPWNQRRQTLDQSSGVSIRRKLRAAVLMAVIAPTVLATGPAETIAAVIGQRARL